MKAWPLFSGSGVPPISSTASRITEEDFWSYTTGVGLSFSSARMNSTSDFSFCTGAPVSSRNTARSPSPSKATPRSAPQARTASLVLPRQL